MTYDYREVQKELGKYECGQCPRCDAKLHRCPFCGEKLCVECGWDEQAPPIESDTKRMREIIDKVNERVATDPDILQRKEELIRELSITQEDLDKVISIIKHKKRSMESP